ncbi:MAG: hypothetical protein M1167_06240 [Chloroflexi bacterium]|nr:hypothetical protein [Chloroflexota bacterium]
MVDSTAQQPKQLQLLEQLVGEWSVGAAMKTSNGKVLSGCGTMTAKETPAQPGITSEMDMHIEGLDDYFESDLWSFDQATGKMHLFSVTSQGDAHDDVGEWTDDKTLELSWKGCFEKEDLEEKITVHWLSKDQIDVKETALSKGKVKLSVNYVFKRKTLNQAA